MQSIEKQIEKSIKRKPKGALIMPDDYIGYGWINSNVRMPIRNETI